VTRVLLIRHGEPEDDARGRCYGRLDVRLSDDGRAHARQLSDLASDVVYTSPRRRARETAELLGAALVDERLRELDFGELEGRTYDEIASEHPDLYRRWMEEPTRVCFPGGEGFDDLRARACSALAEIRGAHDGATIAVVTHGGVIRAALADVLGLPAERIFAFDVAYCSVSVIDWLGEHAIVRLVNGTGADVPAVALS
jgi:alpha-ribazole phosphatase/probable phosphoglycerate mutase